MPQPTKRCHACAGSNRRVRLRQCKYLNNVIEQDHRLVKKLTWLAQGATAPFKVPGELSATFRTGVADGRDL
jgi:transposase-like protein